MRQLVSIFAVLSTLALLFVASWIGASESGEVVTLRVRADDGEVHETRLWVVEYDGRLWLRAGDPRSPWLARVKQHPAVEIERNEEPRHFRATLVRDADVLAHVNARVLEKYGFAERYMLMLKHHLMGLDLSDATAVRLDPETGGA